VRKYSQACPILVDVRKNILVTLQFFAFLHSQGHKRTFAVSALLPIATAKADSCKSPCPLYPQKQTFAVQLGMSALGQKRT
jgi:hypothetical protein